MCRIAGSVDTGASVESLKGQVEKMCLLQKHGGPDDAGLFAAANSHVVFGHRRLSIIDLSTAAHQPMAYANDKLHLTYNGEIYNYKELKKNLQSLGCQFNTNSDTEVILAAYSQWGVHAFDKFVGMFAFALYDANTNELYLVRDTEGIKPLYYAVTKNGIAFASEVRAFTAIPGLDKENEDWKVFLMAYGHIPEPNTTLKNVLQLPKATYLVYRLQTGKYSVHSYNSLNHSSDIIKDRIDAIELIRELLSLSVKRHMISDAPIGVFLSGGLDSSILAMLANRTQTSSLNTLSIYFEDELYSEKKYQDELKTILHCNHHQHLVTEKAFHESLPDVIQAMDIPSCDGINTWFISKYARENGLKAVLSGIGGDELFGGYPSFKRMRLTNGLANLPKMLLRSGRYWGNTKYKRIAYLSIKGIVGKYLFLRGQFIPSEIAEYLDMSESEVWAILEKPFMVQPTPQTAQEEAAWMETHLYMQNQLLRDADVMSMAHGLEIRVPFLDKEFVQVVNKIDATVKFGQGLPKQLLIDAFKTDIPENIWNRSKMGFTFPFAQWLKNDNYASGISNKKFEPNRKKFMEGNMHWSQFFTMMLIENHGKA